MGQLPELFSRSQDESKKLSSDRACPRPRRLVFHLWPLLLLLGPSNGLVLQAADAPETPAASSLLRGSYCTYGAAPLLADKRVAVRTLVDQIVDLHANTYRWIFRPEQPDNLADLKLFLPLAAAKNIRVWITVNPPSERPKGLSPEVMHREYREWAQALARLSLAETNFVAWSIDDFVWNLKFFTPDEVKAMVLPAREINPRFGFVPCCYYSKITRPFARDYGPMLDGVMFPYRDESAGANFQNSDHVEKEVKHVRELFGPACPIIVGVFASRHSKLGLSTPDYVKRVMVAAKPWADGVSVYRHPNKTSDPEKYAIVKELFSGWSRDKKE